MVNLNPSAPPDDSAKKYPGAFLSPHFYANDINWLMLQ